MDKEETISLTKTADDTAVTSETASENAAEESGKSRKKQRKKRNIYDVTRENDIKYRGPLSYRSLKVIGWLSIIFTQYVMLMELKEKLVPTDGTVVFGSLINSLITSLALPTLLISGFALLLNGHGKYKRLLMINGGAAAGFIIIYLIIYQRYLLGFMSIFLGGKAAAAVQADELLRELPDYNGFVAFNIFLDLFLCTILLYFVNYQPKKYFTGKKIYIFRSFAVLPVLYEIASITVKILCTNNVIFIPAAAYPLLTTKPPMCFVMFFLMVMFIKHRERNFIKHGKTHEEYREFLRTNTNSLQFSAFMAGIVLICSVTDILIYIILIAVHLYNSGAALNTIEPGQLDAASRVVASWGIGGGADMIFLVPIMLLFSYTRTHKNPLIDTAIPAVSIIGIVFVYIESALDIARSLFGQYVQ